MRSFKKFISEAYGEVDPKTRNAFDNLENAAEKLKSILNGQFKRIVSLDHNADMSYMKILNKKIDNFIDELNEFERSAADVEEKDDSSPGGKMLNSFLNKRKKK